jgi:hypothetical protein
MSPCKGGRGELRWLRFVRIVCDRSPHHRAGVVTCEIEAPVSLLSRAFGARRYVTARPTDEQVAAVDIPRMLEQARARGDQRSDNEIAAALLLGADLTAERHRDPELRQRAAAASVATRDWLVARVGEDETARLLSVSLGPVGE